jgi:TetR/AcrR family transcriptional regulator, mexJK operon transcriptional repressor
MADLLHAPPPAMVRWGALMNQTMIRKGRKFDQVLDGARIVFMRDGFEGASVDDIAREAGVSKATLYSYFPDKRLLFTEILRTECRRQTEEAEAEIGYGLPLEQMLTLAGERIAGFLMSDFGRSICRLVMAEGQRFPALAKEFYQNGPGLVHERLVHHLGFLVQAGILAIDDVDLAADQFAQLCKAAIHEKLLFGMSDTIRQEDVTRSVTGAVQMFLARYGVPGAVPPKGC